MAKKSKTSGEPTIAITLPKSTAVQDAGYVARHVQARLDTLQGTALRQLLFELDRADARLDNGRRVVSTADVVKYLLEQYAATRRPAKAA